MYFYRDPKAKPERNERSNAGIAIELKLASRIRERVAAWRAQGYPGVTRTTHDLLYWWRRDGREKRLFFAQVEAAEIIVFLTEARPDFRQGIDIPRDDPSDDRMAEGYTGFLRYGSKMPTGSGKTTVMGMLAAWSILNKVNNRSDGRFSDLARTLTRDDKAQPHCSVPSHVLFPQLADIVQRYLQEKVRVQRPARISSSSSTPTQSGT